MRIDYTNKEIFKFPKPPKTEKKQRQKIKGKKHRQTKQTEIDPRVKVQVWERDNHRCIFCGKLVTWHNACCHYVPRSAGGLGVVKNIFTGCNDCHREQDNGLNSEIMTAYAKQYLMSKHADWNEEELIYKKF